MTQTSLDTTSDGRWLIVCEGPMIFTLELDTRLYRPDPSAGEEIQPAPLLAIQHCEVGHPARLSLGAPTAPEVLATPKVIAITPITGRVVAAAERAGIAGDLLDELDTRHEGGQTILLSTISGTSYVLALDTTDGPDRRDTITRHPGRPNSEAGVALLRRDRETHKLLARPILRVGEPALLRIDLDVDGVAWTARTTTMVTGISRYIEQEAAE